MSSERKLRFGLWFDFRNPAQWRQPWHELWSGIIDHIAWAETIGWDDVWLTEHHFADDGYTPSPLVLATAIATRTKRMRISSSVMLIPLYHPVRLAEDGATLDIISNGRYELGVGLGYRPEEFAGYGIQLSGRGTRANEALQIIRRLWEGENVTFHGKHFDIVGAKLSPLPVQKPHPPIWVGGFSRYALRRAARYGDGLLPGGDFETCYNGYVEELRACGKDPSKAMVSGGNAMYFIVSNDPEKTWHELAPHVLYQINMYADWMKGTDSQVYQRLENEDQLKATGLVVVVTPEEAVAQIKAVAAKFPIDRWTTMVQPPGYPIAKAAEHIELFATKVIPHFR